MAGAACFAAWVGRRPGGLLPPLDAWAPTLTSPGPARLCLAFFPILDCATGGACVSPGMLKPLMAFFPEVLTSPVEDAFDTSLSGIAGVRYLSRRYPVPWTSFRPCVRAPRVACLTT